MAYFGLVDCNNFYASCERVFAPKLATHPIVILSNNDGCIIARSNEAKKLGIPMGAPFFKWKSVCQKNNVTVLSSNYELYGDMSGRIMTLLEEFCPDMECYSIDEAFLFFDNSDPAKLVDQAISLRRTLLQSTGIPVSIGIASSKTLAKVANHIAKKSTASGVFLLHDKTSADNTLAKFPVGDIWGIGKKLKIKLEKLEITTAIQLRDSDTATMRKQFGVTMERTILELRGIACHGLEMPQPRKQIVCSRSFGQPVTLLYELEEAVSHYIATVCRKLRAQHGAAKVLHVFIHTNRFHSDNQQYHPTATYTLPFSTDDTVFITKMAKKCLGRIFRSGLSYKKAGVMLGEISDVYGHQASFFVDNSVKQASLMTTVDEINKKMGKNTLIFLAEGMNRGWQNKRQRCSPRYTTDWKDLVTVIL